MAVLGHMKFDSDGITSFPKFRQSLRNERIVWSAEWPTDSLLVMHLDKSRSLELQCLVKPVRGKYTVRHVNFCFQFKTGSLYHTVNKDHSARIKAASVTFTFDQTVGAKAILLESLPPFHLSCNITNSQGSISSNRIFVLDLRPFYIDKFETNNSVISLHKPNGGSEFECMSVSIRQSLLSLIPSGWVLPEIQFDYKWHLCSGVTLSECQRTAEPFPHGTQINSDGKLYVHIPESTDFRREDIEEKKLLCTVFGEPMRFYTKSLKIKYGFNGTGTLRVEQPKIGESDQNKIFLLNATGYRKTLDCYYFYANKLANHTWTHTLKNSTNVIRGTKGLTAGNQLLFLGSFTSDVEGTYNCHINLYSQVGRFERRITGSYSVSILNFPTVSSEVLEKDVYIAGNRISLTCNFDAPREVTPGIGINGKDLNMTDSAHFNDEEQKIRHSLKGLTRCPNTRTSVRPFPPRKGKSLEYMACTSESLKQEHWFYFTCIGNEHSFRVRKNVIVLIAARPKIIFDVHAARPDCTSSNQCKYGCHISGEEWYVQNGFIPRYQWAVTPIFNTGREVFTDGEREYNLDVLQLQGTNIIRCRILLWSQLSNRIIYSSDDDPRYMKSLSSIIDAYDMSDIKLSGLMAMKDEGNITSRRNTPGIIIGIFGMVLTVASIIAVLLVRMYLHTATEKKRGQSQFYTETGLQISKIHKKGHKKRKEPEL